MEVLLWAAAGVALVPLISGALWTTGRTRLGAGLLKTFADAIDAVNTVIGRAAGALALAMALLQVAIVVMRYVFGLGFVFLQEAMLYMHGMLFLSAIAYTLLRGGHVRVDIFYRTASPRAKTWVDLAGAYLFLFPLATFIFALSFPYVWQSWAILERSRETSGIPYVYVLKTFILVFATLLYAQGLSLAIRDLRILAGLDPRAPEKA